MFVYLPRWGRYGTIAASCALAVGACGTPDLYSDLRPDGPPEVLTVSVNAPDNRDGFAGGGGSLEQVTFCKTQGPNDGAAGAGDSKRPDQVILSDESALEMCPTDPTKPVDERTDALPEAWFVRVQFDELLDASIEDLVPDTDDTGAPTGTYTGTLMNTQPVTLKCESSTGSGLVDVPYDGYYSPSGNSISYPLGPSLVIIPADPTVIATNSECQVTLKSNITDKDGNQVPADQIGPYKFKIAPVQVLVIDPADGGKQDPIAAGVDLTFNTAIDEASLDAAVDITPVPNGNPAGIYSSFETPEEYFISADFPAGGGPFTFTLKQGAMILDQCGKATTLGAPSVDNFTKTTFTTNALKLKSITGATDPGSRIQIAFNQYMDDTTLDASEFTLTPPLATPPVVVESGGILLIYGNYQLGTAYTFTLKAGATIDDCPGGEAEFFGAPCVKSATYTSPMDQTVMFTTASAITLKSIAPKDNTTETVSDASDPASPVRGIKLTFNQAMDATTLDPSDYTITPAVALTAGSSGLEALRLSGTFAPGTYTFTLKSTAVIKDLLGNSFSPAADQVIHFTVTPDPTPTPHTCL